MCYLTLRLGRIEQSKVVRRRATYVTIKRATNPKPQITYNELLLAIYLSFVSCQICIRLRLVHNFRSEARLTATPSLNDHMHSSVIDHIQQRCRDYLLDTPI